MNAPPPPTNRRGRRRTPANAGFTLIEVMLAIGILVSITVIVWGSIGLSFQARDHMVKSFDQFQSLRQGMDRMTRELSMAFIATHANRRENLPDPKGLLEAELAASGEGEIDSADQRLQDALADQISKQIDQQKARKNYYETAFIGKSQEVTFTSMAHVRTRADEKSSEQCEVSYFVRTSRRRQANGRLVRELVRREDISLDDDVEDGGVIYTLIDEVEDVKFEYWKSGKEGDQEDGGRWVDSWDSRKAEFRGTLPRRVRITVTVPRPGAERGDRNTRTFTTQAQIMMTSALAY